LEKHVAVACAKGRHLNYESLKGLIELHETVAQLRTARISHSRCQNEEEAKIHGPTHDELEDCDARIVSLMSIVNHKDYWMVFRHCLQQIKECFTEPYSRRFALTTSRGRNT
jgi:hypothetical protein